jgi:elongation factor P hydroxylase
VGEGYVEIVHAYSLSYVAMANAHSLKGNDGIAYLYGHDHIDFHFISVTRKFFAPVFLKIINTTQYHRVIILMDANV